MAKPKIFDLPEVMVEPPRPLPALVPPQRTLGAVPYQAGNIARAPAPDTGEPPLPASYTMDPSWSGLPPALSHPSAAAARASMLRNMQRQRGNAYVQKLLSRTPTDEPVETEATADLTDDLGEGETPLSSQVAPASPALPAPDLIDPTAVAQKAKAEKDKQDEVAAVKQKVDEAVKEAHTKAATGVLPADKPAPEAGLTKTEGVAAARTRAEAEAAAPSEAIQKPAASVPGKNAVEAKPPAVKTSPAGGATEEQAQVKATPAAGAAPPEAELEAKTADKEAAPGKVGKGRAAPGAGGKPAPQGLEGRAPVADGAAASEDAADIVGFQTQLSTRVAAIPRPNLGPAAGGAMRISSAGKSAAAAHGTRRTSLPKEAQAAVSESPKVKESPPAEQDPVPEAAELVNKASNLTLAP
jgi:hypothetical protein